SAVRTCVDADKQAYAYQVEQSDLRLQLNEVTRVCHQLSEQLTHAAAQLDTGQQTSIRERLAAAERHVAGLQAKIQTIGAAELAARQCSALATREIDDLCAEILRLLTTADGEIR
ncbi:MAG: hypothetical protein AAB263_10915, partial [Planctomycetota bacterium]